MRLKIGMAHSLRAGGFVWVVFDRDVCAARPCPHQAHAGTACACILHEAADADEALAFVAARRLASREPRS